MTPPRRAICPLYRICPDDCTGGIYAAPTDRTVNFTLPLGHGRGVPRPYRAVVFYCPVGRGDPTPPCDLPVISHCPDDCNGRSMTAPTPLFPLVCPCVAYIYIHSANIFQLFLWRSNVQKRAIFAVGACLTLAFFCRACIISSMFRVRGQM